MGHGISYYATRAECIEREIVERAESAGIAQDARSELDIEAIAATIVREWSGHADEGRAFYAPVTTSQLRTISARHTL